MKGIWNGGHGHHGRQPRVSGQRGGALRCVRGRQRRAALVVRCSGRHRGRTHDLPVRGPSVRLGARRLRRVPARPFGTLSAQFGWDARTQPRRLLTFALDGHAALPPAPAKGALRPTVDAGFVSDAAAEEKGGVSYAKNCFFCHGAAAIGGGSAPDLRASPALGSAGVLSPDRVRRRAPVRRHAAFREPRRWRASIGTPIHCGLRPRSCGRTARRRRVTIRNCRRRGIHHDLAEPTR